MIKGRDFFWMVRICMAGFFLFKGLKWIYLYGVAGQSTAVDLQWSVLRVVLKGINPYWLFEQENGFGNSFIMGQGPSYLQFIYLVLLPIGLLSLEIAKKVFAMLSAGVFLAGLLCIWRGLRLGKEAAFILVSAAFGMPAFGYCLSNGQMSTLVFGSLAIGTYLETVKTEGKSINRLIGGIIYGISFCKWGYMPGFLVNAVFQRSLLFSISTLVPTLVGFIAFLNLQGSLPFKIFGPYLVVSKKWAWGFTDAAQTDFMSLLEAIFVWQEDANNPLTIAEGLLRFAPYLGVIVSTMLIGFIAYRSRKLRVTPWASLSISILVLLIFIKHLPYDNMLVLVPLAFSWSGYVHRLSTRIIVSSCFSWFWLYPYFNTKVLALVGSQTSEMIGIAIGLASLIVSAVILFADIHSYSQHFGSQRIGMQAAEQ